MAYTRAELTKQYVKTQQERLATEKQVVALKERERDLSVTLRKMPCPLCEAKWTEGSTDPGLHVCDSCLRSTCSACSDWWMGPGITLCKTCRGNIAGGILEQKAAALAGEVLS